MVQYKFLESFSFNLGKVKSYSPGIAIRLEAIAIWFQASACDSNQAAPGVWRPLAPILPHSQGRAQTEPRLHVRKSGSPDLPQYGLSLAFKRFN